jgi:hypothetical protein
MASLSGVSAGGRPPMRPRARAAVRPAMVRSRIDQVSFELGERSEEVKDELSELSA